MRVIPALLAAALLALAGGCGGSGGSGSAGEAPSVVPEDVAAYVSVDTSFEGEQWRAVKELLAQFPGGESELAKLLDEEELPEALGPETVVAVLPGPSGADREPPVVVLTQPDDPAAFDRLLEGSDTARERMRGWEVVAYDEEVLDRYRESLEGPSLESSDAFTEAMADLPEDAAARLYANGEALSEGLSEIPDLGSVDVEAGSIGAMLLAEDEGVRVEGHVLSSGEDGMLVPEAYASELVDEIPADATAFVSFGDLGSALERYGSMFGGGAPIPFDLGGLGTLFGGEAAVYIGPRGEVTLVTQVEDEAAALQAAEMLLGLAGKDAPVAVDAFDGLLAVSSSEKALEALRGDTPRLAQDDRFQDALAAAGMPAETTGFGYVDLESAAPLLDQEAAKAGEHLEPLGSAVFWSEASEDAQPFSLFLGIDGATSGR